MSAWTLPSITSGAAVIRRIAAPSVARSMALTRGPTGSYRPDVSISDVMPVRSSVFDAPWWTCAPSGMSSSTRRFASAPSRAWMTVMPFSSSAAIARCTRALLAGLANELRIPISFRLARVTISLSLRV